MVNFQYSKIEYISMKIIKKCKFNKYFDIHKYSFTERMITKYVSLWNTNSHTNAFHGYFSWIVKHTWEIILDTGFNLFSTVWSLLATTKRNPKLLQNIWILLTCFENPKHLLQNTWAKKVNVNNDCNLIIF